jgi:glucose/arabinose dehydrogenase
MPARLLTAALMASAMLFFAASAQAAPPLAPVITEPATEGQVDSPADVHMEVDGGAFNDPDGDTFECADWEIWTATEKVWQAPCVSDAVLRFHIHLGDGSFVGSYAGRTSLKYGASYTVKVRFKSGGEYGLYATRGFLTETQGPTGVNSAVPWTVRQPGFRVEKAVGGLQLPVDIAFVPSSVAGPGTPKFYVSELYGRIKAVYPSGTLVNYATGLLNFDPTGDFPGSGEQGVTGLAVDPDTGDVFASMVYENGSSHYDKVVRFHSTDGGRTAASHTKILDSYPDWTGPSHQISDLSIGPDDKLYVHVGDGLRSPTPAQGLSSYLGKILRFNLDGSVPSDNPLYNAGDGITATDRILAYGFRNPFGGDWRASNGAHYEVENGPSSNDRLARIDAPALSAVNYGWGSTSSSGTSAEMLTNALYTWSPPHAPVNIAFVQPQTFGGSGFPAGRMDHAFVTESGPTYATGPQAKGKRIVEFVPGLDGEIGESPARTLVEYTGTGKATAAGLAAGPDGLYFTDLYKDQGATSGADTGANVWRIRWAPSGPAPPPPTTAAQTPVATPTGLRAKAIRRCKRKFSKRRFHGPKAKRKKARRKCIRRAKRRFPA